MNRPTKENNYMAYVDDRCYLQFIDAVIAEDGTVESPAWGSFHCEPQSDEEQSAYEMIKQSIYFNTGKTCDGAEFTELYEVDDLADYRELRKAFIRACKKYWR